MGKPSGFKEFQRELPQARPVEERIKDWQEIYDAAGFQEEQLSKQGARCMDCGIPFCMSGCPLGNIIPEFNDLVYKGRMRDALAMLLKTNNFPEFTGRICPAPCEEACVLGLKDPPVTIKLIEESIIEKAFLEGWVSPVVPKKRTGKKVAIVGSGPAGLAAAAQLNSAGHWVTVYERADRIGGLLRYGIPEFKLEKRILDRRIRFLEEEGIKFVVKANVGDNIPVIDLLRSFDIILLAGGATKPRDLDVPGRELIGIYPAMEFLSAQNRRNLGEVVPGDDLLATGKHVVVLGGGDTGSDCLGTAIRHQAKSVVQFELLPQPPASRSLDNPWPSWPMVLRSSTSHEEGGQRDWSINTKSFSGNDGVVKKLQAAKVDWQKGLDGKMSMREIPGTEFEIDCDLCLLAMGFVHPEHEGLLDKLEVGLDKRGNVITDDSYQTSVPGVFAAGDLRRGQSLVVWAIAEGRKAAKAIDIHLMGRSELL